MSQIKAELIQKILNHYLQSFKEDNEEAKKLIKNLANVNTRFVILSLIDHLNILETDQKFLELFKLLGYILSHLQEKHFDIVKDRIHEFLQNSIGTAVAQGKKQMLPKEIAVIYNERDIILQKMVGTILRFRNQDTLRLLLNLFVPGRVPDTLTLSLISLLVQEEGERVCEYSNELLGKFLSTWTLVVSSKMRQTYAEIMLALYDGLSLCLENQGQLNLKSLEDLTLAIYSMISQDWLGPNLDPICEGIVISLIGHMIQFFPSNQVEKIADKVVEQFITQMKKPELTASIWQGFNKVLEKLLVTNKPYFEHSVKSMQVKLYDLYKGPIFSPNYPFTPEVQKKKNALLQILQSLAEFNADSITDLYISRHSSKEIIEKIAVLWITNFLTNRNYTQMSIPMKKLLVNSLQNLQFETHIEVRFVIVELIFSLCNQPTFFSEVQSISLDISFMLFFLMKQVSIHPQEIAEKNSIRSPPFITSLESLKTRASYVLQLLTTLSVEQSSNSFIWPSILQYIPNPSFSPGLSCVLKSIATYLSKYHELHNAYPDSSLLKISDKVPKINTILTRLIILLRIPQYFKGLGLEILAGLPHILQAFLGKELPRDVLTVLRDLQYTINSNQDESKLCEKIYQLWKVLLEQFDDREWFSGLHEDLIAVNSSYNKIPELQVHMMKLHAIVLTKVESQETVRTQIDRFISQVYNDYANHTVNPNIERVEPTVQMKYCLADSLALVATVKLDFVIDKIRNVFTSQILPKKQQSGFASGILGMLKKTNTDDELLTPIAANLVLSLGYICNRLASKELAMKMESQIINNLIPFMEKSGEDMQINVQRCLEMVSRAVVRIQGDCEESQIKELKRVFIKYKQVFLDRSMTSFKYSKIPNIKTIAWETITHLFKLDSPYHFEVHFEFFKDCLAFLEENTACLNLFEHPVVLLFEAMIYHPKLLLKETSSSGSTSQTASAEGVNNSNNSNKNGVISLWEIIERMISLIESKKSEANVLSFYYNCLLKALFNKKLKVQDSSDIKYLTVVLVIFLSHVYKAPGELQKVSLFVLEKLMIGLEIYLEVSAAQDLEIFNKQLISQLSGKLSFEELQRLVTESVQRVGTEGSVSVLNGFTSLQNKFYTLNEERLSDQLAEVLSSYQQVFEIHEKLQSEEAQKEQLIGYVFTAIEKNLQKGLDVFLEEKTAFQLSEFLQRVLKRMVAHKGTLFKTFNHLTDVLNNPEDKLFRSKGQAMTNAIHFIGYIFSLNSQVLLDITKKYFHSIFGTFLLRFATSLDYDLNKNAQSADGMSASKICLWSFKQMLENSSKSCFLDDLSVGLQQKLLVEDQFEDGMSELLMVISKNSKLSEIMELMEFLRPFLQKKLASQKQLSLIIVSQLIQSSFFSQDFKEYRVGSTLEEWYNSLIDALLAQAHENSDQIRSLIFRGIGNITYLHKYNIAGCQGSAQQINKEEINTNNNTENLSEQQQAQSHMNNLEPRNSLTTQQKLLDENLAENIEEILLKEEEHQRELEKKIPPIFLISNERYSQILEVLFDGMDDSADSCVRDVLNSLQNIIPFISDTFLAPYLHTLLVKVTNSFEKQATQTRVSAFNLFGKLLEKIELYKESAEYLDNELHYVIVSIIVHLQDESRQVHDVCKLNLLKIAASLKFTILQRFLEDDEDSNENQQKDSSEENKDEDLHDELEFLEGDERQMLQIMKIFINNYSVKNPIYVETLIEFTKSPDEKIRCSSLLNLFLAFRYLEEDPKYTDIGQRVKERLLEIIEQSRPNSRINSIDKYILKASVLLINAINS